MRAKKKLDYFAEKNDIRRKLDAFIRELKIFSGNVRIFLNKQTTNTK